MWFSKGGAGSDDAPRMEWEDESSTLMMSLSLAVILQEVGFSLMVDTW